MVERIYHVGLTVSDLDRSIAFYRDILGLEFQGEIFMAGEETDRLFRMKDTKARVAYLNGSKAIEAPPIELIQFVDNKVKKVKGNLFTTSISEVCFYTNDIERVYNSLIENHVECLSEPQYFDFRANELNSVYTRSSQNSTPNSNATNLHCCQKRCCSFGISSSNASPAFQVQKSIFHQMTKPIQVTVILPLLLAISLSWNDDIHSSISGISNDLIGVIPTIGQ